MYKLSRYTNEASGKLFLLTVYYGRHYPCLCVAVTTISNYLKAMNH